MLPMDLWPRVRPPQAGAMPCLALSVAFLFFLWLQLQAQGVAWGPGVVTCPLREM